MSAEAPGPEKGRPLPSKAVNAEAPEKGRTLPPKAVNAEAPGKGMPLKAGAPVLSRGAGGVPAQAPQGKPPGKAFFDPAPTRQGGAAGPLSALGGGPRETALPVPFREALSALGLPGDDLSTALLDFVRHFSLPLEGGLLRRLRREALGPSPGSRSREAAALAAVAAADKGMGLSAEALEAYAAALDPPPPRGGGEGAGEEGRGKRDGGPSPEAGEIREKALQAEAASPLLGFLNRAPGKNGGRWVVLPFAISQDGVSLGVSLRIWLQDRGALGFEAERLALDIAAESRRWLFIVDKPMANKSGRIAVYVDPLPQGASPGRLEGEIREALGEQGEIVFHGDGGGEIPAFADAREETLPRIDEEV